MVESFLHFDSDKHYGRSAQRGHVEVLQLRLGASIGKEVSPLSSCLLLGDNATVTIPRLMLLHGKQRQLICVDVFYMVFGLSFDGNIKPAVDITRCLAVVVGSLLTEESIPGSLQTSATQSDVRHFARSKQGSHAQCPGLAKPVRDGNQSDCLVFYGYRIQ